MKLQWSGIEWGGPKSDWYYVYWWNWLQKHNRYFGYEGYYYDGPIHTFGLWFINISWSTPWW